MIFYICDRRLCKNCHAECKHTSDISHAVNFECIKIDKETTYIEKINDEKRDQGEND